ncbi:50S ribosomal protein L24e [Candidatus Micrarchaeota archaeon]|nr:MAG: 50S ribosomal protein L24e [Candidatus Micrarchaeota archaeon]
MVKCSFCGKEIPKGTGKIYVLKDGTAYYYCSSKCERNHLKLKRKPAKTTWVKKAKKEGKE